MRVPASRRSYGQISSEVVLMSVDVQGETLEVRVLEIGRHASNALTLDGTTTVSAGLVSMLREWCALRTPMLLYVETAGVASLTGPVTTIPALRVSKNARSRNETIGERTTREI